MRNLWDEHFHGSLIGLCIGTESLEVNLIKYFKDLKSGYPLIIPLPRVYPKGVIQDAFKD